jgi:hypothetical protein
MTTLDRWLHFLTTPRTLSCARMELRAGDWEPPIVTGKGEMRLPNLRAFEFTLRGQPKDVSYTFEQINRQKQNPYDGLKRFRLVVWDESGIEYAAGWTIPDIDVDNNGLWIFSGEFEGGLWISDQCEPTERGRTELIFPIPRRDIASHYLTRFVQPDTEADGPAFQHEIEVQGTPIRFAFNPTAQTLTIGADASTYLPLTYSENWLGEPLRILFGQLIYPRLIARNLPDGTAHVSVRPSPGFSPKSPAALWRGESTPHRKEDFWKLYSQLLTYISKSRDKTRQRNFEANKITQLYVEVIQATQGSRWVWALTIASSIEGLAQILIPRGTKRNDIDNDSIESLSRHIHLWGGDVDLKSTAIGAVRRTTEMTVRRTLKRLVDQRAVTPDQFSAWEKLRNSVMHGSLVSPYSSEEEDNRLIDLAALMHKLTREIVGFDAHDPA